MNYEEYQRYMRQTMDLGSAVALLSWDKEVYMPPKSIRFRAQQLATLSAMAHHRFTDPEFGESLKKLLDNHTLTDNQRRNITLTIEDFDKEKKLPGSFVEELSRTTAEANHSWVQARKENAYQQFSPYLKKLILLKREEADMRGYAEKPYDALLDIYEPGCTTHFLDSLFSNALPKIIQLIQQIKDFDQVSNEFLFSSYHKDHQWEFGVQLLKSMGYDFDHGRQDISAHPFTISFSPEDVRVTTRIDEHDFSNMTWSCIHEGGHALYEQGLPVEEYGLPLGTSASLGIHESQSRLWENHVGRSIAYWTYWFPLLQEKFPSQLKGVDLSSFYAAINRIAPNLIRTEADELHYHIHVIIRFEIEKALINDQIDVMDLNDFWNEKYQQYMGIDVPDDANGILQDVHWSHGSFGYFPTYSLGSFYAAQFYAKAVADMPHLEAEIQQGKTNALLNWLRSNVHQHGRKNLPNELCENITGEGLNVDHFIKYANEKFLNIYC